MDFREKILPNLEVLLQFSLQLTVNGRDAVGLLRKALAEVFQSWDTSLAAEGCSIRLQEIIIRRFLSGIRRSARPLVPVSHDDNDENLFRKERLVPGVTADARRKLPLTGESEEGDDYIDSIAGLPAVLRSAMILSYLEGFSNSEIAGLAGVQPQAIELLLKRGRELIREELFAYLMGNRSLGVPGDEAAPGKKGRF